MMVGCRLLEHGGLVVQLGVHHGHVLLLQIVQHGPQMPVRWGGREEHITACSVVGYDDIPWQLLLV